MKSVNDGDHGICYPDRGYREFSRTSSGGTIYVNRAAPKDKRWWIKHPSFGDRYFAEHSEILVWTVEQMRLQFKAIHGDLK